MKNCFGVLLGLACVLCAGRVLGATTAFTYQGQLKDNGAPVSGSVDFTFALFDAASGGAQVGTTVGKSGVTVTGGLFTVELDFGAPAFGGADRFLEVAAKAAGAASFTTFSARQKLTPTPYALFAQNAGTATSATTASTANSIAAANLPIAGTTAATRGVVYADGTTIAVAADGKLSAAASAPPDGAVTSQKIADSAVTSAKIADGAIATADLAAGAVDLTTKVSGLLPIANGGTGQATASAAFNALSPLTTKGDLIVRDASGNVRLPVGVDGQVLAADSTTAEGIKWIAVGGTGTVTSVGLAAPAEFTVSGSPVTTSGTLTLAKANQSANLVYAGPSSGGAAAPGFRSLVAADIPVLDASQITTGTLADARLSGNVTLQGNTFNGTNQLVKLDGAGKLPAVDGSLLANVAAPTGTVVLLSADETDSAANFNTSEVTLKSFNLPANTFSLIIIETELRARGSDAGQIGYTWRFKEGVTVRKALVWQIVNDINGTSDQQSATLKASFAGGQASAVTVSVTGQMDAAGGGSILAHSFRVYGVK